MKRCVLTLKAMQDSSLLINLLKIAPIAIVLAVAVIVVFRGLSRDGDSTNNRAKGGGPRWWPGSD